MFYSIFIDLNYSYIEVFLEDENLTHKLEGKIYMERPKGYTDFLLTCKLRNPLYGLKQGPRAWNPKFNSSVLSQRLERSNFGCKSNIISSLIWHQIGRRWRGSHALYQGTSAHKDHHIEFSIEMHTAKKIYKFFYSGRNCLLV